MKRTVFLSLVSIVLLTAAGCQTAYYATMEKFGVHKRDILVDRVQEARDEQQEAKQEFSSALARFRSVVNFDSGDLQQKYDNLSADYDRCAGKADAVKSRISKVEDVAEALFKEWEGEIAEYTNASLKQSSQNQMIETRARYEKVVRAMRRAEQKIQPVLSAFKDQVLFLKHNLNARAISSLQTELKSVENDIATLIKEMETSINEANRFIAQMGK